MKSKSVGFVGLINIAIFVLKVCDVIKWSWFVVIPCMIIISLIPFFIKVILIMILNR